MRAVAVTPEQADSMELVEWDDPTPAEDECLVRVLECGIDGTDREIVSGEYGEGPDGADRLIIGHECAGIVERATRTSSDLAEGMLVVPTVRRGCPQQCPNCAAGEQDFCATGDYLERGIKGAHGFMCELFTERPEHLIPVPDDLRDVAVLLEPLSILERSYRLIFEIQQRLVWDPRHVLITGAGNMGIMAAFLARLHGLEALIYSEGEQQGAAGAIMDRIGCDYADSESEPLEAVVRRLGAPDIVIEATGYSPLAWETAGILAVNGVACLLSVTQGDTKVKIPSDELNTDLVLGNRLIFGSVNAHRQDFERGVEDLREIREQWPGVLEQFITHRRPLAEYARGLAEEDPNELKTVLEVSR